MTTYTIAVIVGRLRKDSINKKLANAIVKLAPPEFTFKQLRIDDLPLYNQHDDANQIASVKRLKGEIADAQINAGGTGVRFLLLSGKPIGEPVVWYGPIVMNAREELQTAFEEYEQGTFLKHK